ncbi:hypothetical protein, partial [Secundilactobacillus paracollinoides]|uniref:hypothetical protein n=1 Tax=Secundilactobacillus paracollinoides TaxID=240427 RepID=UPI000AAF2256
RKLIFFVRTAFGLILQSTIYTGFFTLPDVYSKAKKQNNSKALDPLNEKEGAVFCFELEILSMSDARK